MTLGLMMAAVSLGAAGCRGLSQFHRASLGDAGGCGAGSCSPGASEYGWASLGPAGQV
jgi:hypothetical protein